MCEVRVDGYTYVGAGNSVTKKEAQKNASRDFINYLVRSGEVNATEVPEDVSVKNETSEATGNSGIVGNIEPDQSQTQRPVFQVINMKVIY